MQYTQDFTVVAKKRKVQFKDDPLQDGQDTGRGKDSFKATPIGFKIMPSAQAQQCQYQEALFAAQGDSTCMLMTSGERFYTYSMEFKTVEDEPHLLLTRLARKGSDKTFETIVYQLLKVHACTVESSMEKNLDNDKRLWGLELIDRKSRKLFFPTCDKMKACLKQIHSRQGYSSSRREQYEVMEILPKANEEENYRAVVRQSLTGKILTMVVEPHTSSSLDTRSQRATMLSLRALKYTTTIIDKFDIGQEDFIVLEDPSGEPLRELLLGQTNKHLKESDARRLLSQILALVQQIQEKDVCHNNINLDTVLIKNRSKGLQVNLKGFQKVKTYVKRNPELKSCTNVLSFGDRQQALSNDVVQVGFLAYHIIEGISASAQAQEEISATSLCTGSAFSGANWSKVSPQLKELICLMTEENPGLRLTPQLCLNHPWFSFV